MPTVSPTTEPVYLRTGTVRLVERHGDVGPGTVGYLIGKFARKTPTYLVSVPTAGVIEVRGDEIVAAAA
jgi:hypothetical protein